MAKIFEKPLRKKVQMANKYIKRLLALLTIKEYELRLQWNTMDTHENLKFWIYIPNICQLANRRINFHLEYGSIPYHRILLSNCDSFKCHLGQAELKFLEFLFHLCFWLACATLNVLVFHLYILLDKVSF